MTPTTKVMGVDPMSLDTTTMCIADTLPESHAGDTGLLERKIYSSDTKNERISISPSISLSQDSVSNSHFPGTKSLLSTSQLLPKLLKYSIKARFTKRGIQDFIQVDPPILSNGCLVVQLKLAQLVINVVDRRAQTVNTHGKKYLLSLYDGRRRTYQTTLYFFSRGKEVSSTIHLSFCSFVAGIQFCPFHTILM